MYATAIGGTRYVFPDLVTLLGRASPLRSGDVLAGGGGGGRGGGGGGGRASPLRSGAVLAGVAAASSEERVAAQYALADLPLATFLQEPVVPYDTDEVTRLIVDTHDAAAFAPVSHLTVGGLRDWLLSDAATPESLAALAPGITPEMAAAVAKIMSLQDLMVAAAKSRGGARLRNTLGVAGPLSVRLPPNHP